MEKVLALLEANKPIRDGEFSSVEVDMIVKKLGHLITSKPISYLINLTEKDYLRKKNKWLLKIHTWIKEHGGGVMIPFSVEFEQKLWERRSDPAVRLYVRTAIHFASETQRSN
jgi:obg-like ATPase 1